MQYAPEELVGGEPVPSHAVVLDRLLGGDEATAYADDGSSKLSDDAYFLTAKQREVLPNLFRQRTFRGNSYGLRWLHRLSPERVKPVASLRSRVLGREAREHTLRVGDLVLTRQALVREDWFKARASLAADARRFLDAYGFGLYSWQLSRRDIDTIVQSLLNTPRTAEDTRDYLTTVVPGAYWHLAKTEQLIGQRRQQTEPIEPWQHELGRPGWFRYHSGRPEFLRIANVILRSPPGWTKSRIYTLAGPALRLWLKEAARHDPQLDLSWSPAEVSLWRDLAERMVVCPAMYNVWPSQ